MAGSVNFDCSTIPSPIRCGSICSPPPNTIANSTGMDTSMTKRAFTLVELLVVMGILATMATVSIGSYVAVVRGMADRGAIAAATSVISLAKERAGIDLVPTIVYFYNELVQDEDKNAGKDRVVAGVAVAVRRAGRISYIDIADGFLGDEFADLDKVYDAVTENDQNSLKGEAFRLYKVDFSKDEMQYTSVHSDVVEKHTSKEVFPVEDPQEDRNVSDIETSKGSKDDGKQLYVYAFKYSAKGESTAKVTDWHIGSAYGCEFARVRLPDNYVFGGAGNLPDTEHPIRQFTGGTTVCYPKNSDSDDTDDLGKRISIYAKRPGGWESIGESAKKMKDI